MPKPEFGWQPTTLHPPRPAGLGNGFSTATRYDELLASVDTGHAVNHYGVVPELLPCGECYPMAVPIGDAVDHLDAETFNVRDGWHEAFVGDTGECRDDVQVRAEAMFRQMRVSGLVRAVALTGMMPQTPVATFKIVPRTINGRPAWFTASSAPYENLHGETQQRAVEVDGWN